MSHELLLLLDGTGIAYRSYHAIRGLKTRDGRPTNALFGFARALESERAKWNPTHWAVVFDGGRPAERLALLDSYKAQRKPMPDDLLQQLKLIDRYLELAGVPYILIPGKEADDLIAALARRAERRGWDVVVVSSDKDLLQLPSERIRLARPGKHGEVIDAVKVKELTGVEPEQIPLWLALIGDAVDNIPGVPGVGPKKAADLVNRYGSLSGVAAALEEITPPRIREALRKNLPLVERNVNLIRLDSDQDPGVGLEALRVREPDLQRLRPFLEQYELKSLLRKWNGSEG